MAKIAILHPNLGIGGAERLILDCGHALKDVDSNLQIWTNYFSLDHHFEDTDNFHIEVRGSFLIRFMPPFFHIIFSLVAFFWLTLRCALESTANIFIVDQISSFLFLLKFLKPKSKILFYCHFPDFLLARHDTLIRKIYRLPFDFFEKKGLKSADKVIVNSKFTQSIATEVLGVSNVDVLYPCVNERKVERKIPSTPVFVSINRFERKKNISLALESFLIFCQEFQKRSISRPKLIIAGGYDTAVIENVQYLKELKSTSEMLKINDDVSFLPNISNEEKWNLISTSTAVVYTPENEHFGIVPIEALSVGVPVIACNSGGPSESLDVEGCYLSEAKAESFADYMMQCFKASASDSASADSEKLKEYCSRNFSFNKFKEQWKSLVQSFCK